jgi:anti-sigma factor RsiW
MPHMDDGTLHALLDGALDAEAPEQADAVRAHLDACEDCRARLEAASRLRDDASDILGSAAPPAIMPDFDEVVARSRPDGAAASGKAGPPAAATGLRKRYARTRGLAWAATLVLALGTGYLIRDLAGPLDAGPTAGDEATLERAEAPAGEAAEEAVSGGRPGSTEPETGAEAGARPERRTQAGEAAAMRDAPAPPAPRPEALEAAPPAAVGAARGPELGAEAPKSRAGAGDAAPRLAGRWDAVTPAVAREALGGPLYVLPRATVTELYLAQGPEGVEVLTMQRLESGIPVEVVQRPDATAGAAADAAAGPEVAEAEAAREPAAEEAIAADRSLAAQAEAELEASRAPVAAPAPAEPALPPPEAARVTVDGFVLEIRGALPADLLAILGRAARPGG